LSGSLTVVVGRWNNGSAPITSLVGEGNSNRTEVDSKLFQKLKLRTATITDNRKREIGYKTPFFELKKKEKTFL
jgi:hypothetical protein